MLILKANILCNVPDIGGALGVGKTHDGFDSRTDLALIFLLNGFIVTVVVATISVEEVVVAICKYNKTIAFNTLYIHIYK